MGFHTMSYKQTAGGHVADSCQEEKPFSHDAQDPWVEPLSVPIRATLWRVSDLHVQDLTNTAAWKFVAADQSDA